MKKKATHRIRNWSEYTIYGLAGRQTQGFLQSLFDQSLFELMKLELSVPDHSTLSRRRRQLTITLPVKDWAKPRRLVVDSTGVKVYGEGEWKVRQHGVGKRRTWRKLHLCNDEATLEIVSVVASTNDVTDAEALPDLLQDVPGEIKQVSAEGGLRPAEMLRRAQSPWGEGGHPAAQRRKDLAARKYKNRTPCA